MKLSEIASRIDIHLRRFERDPNINVRPKHKEYRTLPYYGARAFYSGSRVFVCYVSYQGDTSLTKAEAQRYLAWLDAGNIGKHFGLEVKA